VQNRIGYFWGQEEVDTKMENIMVGAFHDVWKMAEGFEVSNRIAAYMLAIDRVSKMARIRGVYA
jgi:glutamate dehydrogenase (NAD(P)+)